MKEYITSIILILMFLLMLMFGYLISKIYKNNRVYHDTIEEGAKQFDYEVNSLES